MLGLAQDYYYPEIARPDMDQYLARARLGDFTAVFEKDDAKAPWSFILGSHFDRTRASWMFATRLAPDSGGRRALDFGSGWGINASALTPYFEEVVALDLSWHRLLTLVLLARKRRIGNITAICGGDSPRLPFPDQWFDLVLLNGVIEWVAVGRTGDPRQHQAALLREIARITKPDGELFLASENRYAYHYWAGRPDDHTELLWGSLLPRAVANVYSRIRRRRPYQNYTYSVSQYRRLIGEAGYRSAEFYGLIPTHRLFHKLFPLSRGRILDREEARGTRLKDALLRTRGVARLASALGVRGAFREHVPSYFRRLARSLNAARLVPEPLEPEPYRVITTNFSAKAAIRAANGRSGLLAKIPLTQLKAELQANALREQERWRQSPFVGPLVSPVLKSYAFEGKTLAVESLCLARQRTGERHVSVYSTAQQVLLRFATSAGRGGVVERWQNEVGGLLDYLPAAHKAVLDRVAAVAPPGLKTCYQHGDFHWGNLLADRNRTLERLVDWEWATPEGYPLADLLHLTANHASVGLSTQYVTVLRRAVDGVFPHEQLRIIAAQLLEAHSLEWRDLRVLAVIYLYHTLTKHWEGSFSYGFGTRFLEAAAHRVAGQALEMASGLR